MALLIISLKLGSPVQLSIDRFRPILALLLYLTMEKGTEAKNYTLGVSDRCIGFYVNAAVQTGRLPKNFLKSTISRF